MDPAVATDHERVARGLGDGRVTQDVDLIDLVVVVQRHHAIALHGDVVLLRERVPVQFDAALAVVEHGGVGLRHRVALDDLDAVVGGGARRVGKDAHGVADDGDGFGVVGTGDELGIAVDHTFAAIAVEESVRPARDHTLLLVRDLHVLERFRQPDAALVEHAVGAEGGGRILPHHVTDEPRFVLGARVARFVAGDFPPFVDDANVAPHDGEVFELAVLSLFARHDEGVLHRPYVTEELCDPLGIEVQTAVGGNGDVAVHDAHVARELEHGLFADFL